MPFSDTMFFLEVMVEELKSFIDCKEFYIKCKFSDIFFLNLKDPNDSDPLIQKKSEKKRIRNTLTGKYPAEMKKRIGQSVRFNSQITTLITNMKNFPIEVSLYNKDDPNYKLGAAHVPWSPVFIDYLNMLNAKREISPVAVSGRYNVVEDCTFKRIATVNLNIKLNHKKNGRTPFNLSSKTNQNSFKDPRHISKPKSFFPTIKETSSTINDEKRKTKTVYSIGKRKNKNLYRSVTNKKKIKKPIAIEEEPKSSIPSLEVKTHPGENHQMRASKLCLVKSDSDLVNKGNNHVIKSKSCSSIHSLNYNYLNYVFGNYNQLLSNRVYCVNYFTVENDFDKDSSPSKDTNSTTKKSDVEDETEPESKGRYNFRLCEKDCPSRKSNNPCGASVCSFDLPEEVADQIVVSKCENVKCIEKPTRRLPPPRDDSIRLDLTSMKNDCCTVEKITGGMKAKMKFDEKSCFCSCECKFEFMKHTTYCGICGGYEAVVADDKAKKNILDSPFPCPVYHKLMTDRHRKTLSNSGSDKSKSKFDDSQKSSKKGSKSPTVGKPSATSAESEKDGSNRKKRCRKLNKDRFKFNYGYTAPKIGHTNCVMPCTGTLGAVPKNMGWLWTAEDIPGMKFRPMWRPGATHKHVVRLLRMAKNPGLILSKKKKKITTQKKPLKRPLLTVSKKDGEYTVTMETMKIYPKQRAPNQHPYEDKPLVTYTIGRTEEENRKRQKRKEREQRRLDRDKREFIQSTFTDMCKEICVKTYKQALGLLPDAEDPDCTCYPKYPGPEDTNLDRSCSCSEDNVSYGSDTDSDEWIVEFTPPNATYDPKHKVKKVLKLDRETQYTYLDYKVKLLDRFGNEVPRFFKGPDGKTQCSDLGGFWSPDHKWLEINIDGFIGPDKKWAPLIFRGPYGEQVNCENGKFNANGKWFVVGVDGYVDAAGNWKFYARPKGHGKGFLKRDKNIGDKRDGKGTPHKSENSWSCFGDAAPNDLSKLGILGHGHDKKLLLKALKDMLDHGENVKIPEPSTVPRLGIAKKNRRKDDALGTESYDSHTYFSERMRCRHPVPSDKGIVAVDQHGNKTYFKLKEFKNKRPHQRLAHLTQQGISLSSFHVPCLDSFINSEMMKMQQYKRFLNNDMSRNHEDGDGVNSVNASTQYRYRYTV